MGFESSSDLTNIFIGLIVLCIVVYIFVAGKKKGLNGEIEDPLDAKKSHPGRVFFKYNHASIYIWVAWIKSQDQEIQDRAFDQLMAYLTSPIKQLGVISGDAIKAVVEFGYDQGYTMLRELLSACTNAWGQYKAIETFYEDLAVGLTKYPDKAETEKVLIDTFNSIKRKAELTTAQVIILKALSKLEFTGRVIDIFDEIFATKGIGGKVKNEALAIIENQDVEIQRRVFIRIMETQLKNQQGVVKEDDERLYRSIFMKMKKFMMQEEYRDSTWSLLNKGLDSAKHKPVFIKFFSEAIEFKDEALTESNLLELLNKPEPAKSSFKDAFAKRNALDKKEQELLKSNIKEEDLIFEKDICKLDKSKKTRSIAHELLDEYRALEKDFIHMHDTTKTDKQILSINVLVGNALEEKIYLLRGMAANNNRSFVYVDTPSLLGDPELVVGLRTTVNNSKPCMVYMDNLDMVIEKTLTKSEVANIKDINRIVAEFSILPSVRFVGNVPYTREELKSNYQLIGDRLNGQSHGNYRIVAELNRPDFQKRKNILSSKFASIRPERIDSGGEEFDVNAFAESTDGMSMMQYMLHVNQYFEIALLIYGRLIPYSNFMVLNTQRRMAPET